MTRQMVDKRQSRKDNAPSFKAAIESYASGLTDVPARLGKGMAIKASQGLMPRNDGLGVPVYVRKRPLFAHEVKKNEYDVVAVDAEDMVVVHNCQMHADLKRMHIVHKAFPCAHAFDEHCTNEDVSAHRMTPFELASIHTSSTPFSCIFTCFSIPGNAVP